MQTLLRHLIAFLLFPPTKIRNAHLNVNIKDAYIKAVWLCIENMALDQHSFEHGSEKKVLKAFRQLLHKTFERHLTLLNVTCFYITISL